ncbi:putative PIF1 DNA helicase/replication protein A1-like protein [Senna tora]|uniref:ATP-dependent DNA helicase n=1 Tax=Senna tora TaxID=362788 RepID=A0A834X7D1_9FABA|nr:putative PIF1 DNA helicase/replication protein A1-like protein [Senna tora]
MSTSARDIIVENKSGTLQHIDELHPLYLPMQYPLLFPYGEDGYRPDTLYRDGSINEDRKQRHVTLRQFFAYKLQERRRDFSMILKAGKLTQQFTVDAFTSVESQHTSYVRFHQKKLHSENYDTITEIIAKGQVSSSSMDAMTICATTGFPDLFITFTCNPKWPELDRLLKELGCKAEDRPDLVSRIFKIKLNRLIKDITKDMLYGKCSADIYTIQFQKRGLPHAHILLWLSAEDKFTTASQIDLVIFAEIPNRDAHPDLYEAVNNFMIHGPCGPSRKSSPCMINGSRCSKHFPKKFNERTSFDEAGYCKYRRRDTGNVVIKNGIELDNRFVVPYNPTLLLRYQEHINVEFCNQSQSIKYLFKYVSKGHDMVTAKISSNSNAHVDNMKDEIKNYYDCQYISPCEATWRIFGFDINFREPAVERQPFHLPNQQANKCYPAARELTYAQMPTMFVIKVDSRKWCIRKVGYAIGRLYYVPPGLGELHYMRVLLTFVKGLTCFEEIRTINGVLYPSYKAACYAMGLLDDDKEYVDGITEASHWSSGVYLRNLFSTLLIHNTISRPEYVWDKTWMHLSDDILIKERHRTCNPDLQLHDDRIKDLALAEIENILRSNGRSLLEYPPMPLPSDESICNTENVLMSEELNYDRVLLKSQHSTLSASLTSKQTNIYNDIIDAVDRSEGGVFFVNGFGGSGKTFIWNTLTSAIRGRGQIVLAVASSGIASQLILGGRTAHSSFVLKLWTEVLGISSEMKTLSATPNRSVDFTLTKNMRLRNGNTESENNEIREFADCILKIGDGLIGNEVNDEENEITIPGDILIKNVQYPIEAIVENTFPLFLNKIENNGYIRDRAILALTLDDVASVNDYMLSLLPGEEMTYLSSDSICSQDNLSGLANVYTPEFLNTISRSGLPYHELKLKVGAPVMLLRNIDKSLVCVMVHI